MRGDANEDLDCIVMLVRTECLCSGQDVCWFQSKQSIMTVVLFPKENLKHRGMVLQSSSLSGQLISGDSCTSIRNSQCLNVLDTVD